MKKTFILLMSMLFLTGTLAYVAYVNDFIELPYPQTDKENVSELISQNSPANQSTDNYAVSEETVQIEENHSDLSVTVSGSQDSVKVFQEEESSLLEDKQQERYSYSRLTPEEQNLYNEILWAILEYQENVTLSTLDNNEIFKVFQCVLNDHPEIFYVDGYTYTQYTLADALKKITFTANYSLSQEEKEQRQQEIDNYVNQCIGGMPQGADEYTRVKYIYEYLIEHTEYDAEVEDNQNICSVFLDGRSVCQGYAKATQYLLEKVGIPATLILGTVKGGEGHAWNLVKIDGAWYYVDTTWGDASYQAISETDSYPEQKTPVINYDYLCVTTEQLCKTHTIDNVVEPPLCDSMEDNYYVREGLYITSVDEEQLTCIFQNSYEAGDTFVTLKCSSLDIYNELKEMLITNQAIFRYLNCPDKVVSYTNDEKQYTMSFWL
ncbi:MAG: transglutaminase domain-containing protein [Lachnospiraceae bacterium]|nr:transglutaminase domain-containing protein [Lachnospiraceae bacterium]